ncbi:MAG TPA: GvpL/GvpF family gas vesicle protein [Natronosporangium sp.]
MRRADAAARGPGLHLYGILPAGAPGTADLPEDLTLIPYRRIAALVRPAPTDPSRQLRAYLLAYAEILDRLAGSGPVLPVRFGATFPDRPTVERAALAPHHDDYARALATLAGKAQYTVRARYRGDAAVQEVLAEHPELVGLHRAATTRGTPARRLELGERIARATRRKAAQDAAVVTECVRPYVAAVVVPPVPDPNGDRIADVACLVAQSGVADLTTAVNELAHRWRERARLRLLGPMAPYHFAAGLLGGDRIAAGGRA